MAPAHYTPPVRLRQLHAWDLGPAEARALQRRLAARVVERPLPRRVRVVAALDVAFPRGRGTATAAAVVLRLPGMEVLETRQAEAPALFPYVPGLLSFREGPAAVAVLAALETVPEVILCDGQGVLHPARMGLASHLGLVAGVPTVGCAKSRLCGEGREPGPRRGDRSPLRLEGRVWGAALRTRDGVRPVYVSRGHLSDLEGALRLVLACATRYRIPEPLRLADRLSRCLPEEVTA